MATKEEVFEELENGSYNLSEEALEVYIDYLGEHYIASEDAEDVCWAAEGCYLGHFDGVEALADDLGAFDGVPEKMKAYIDYDAWWGDVKGDYIHPDDFKGWGGHLFTA